MESKKIFDEKKATPIEETKVAARDKPIFSLPVEIAKVQVKPSPTAQ